MGRARRKDKDVSSSGVSQEDSKQYLEATMLEMTTPEYKLREIVNLPEGVDYNEWLASHTLAFFDHINLVYGTISEFCTMSGCPEMSGPGNRQYSWIDEKGKRCKLPAPQYIDYVMTYTQKTVNDESVFPTKFDKEFPISFEAVTKKIIRLLFHVLAHIYHSHFKEIVLLNLHSHVNCIFAHLVLFNDRFKLLEVKEVEVLADLAYALKLNPPLSVETPSVTPEPLGLGAVLENQQLPKSGSSSSSNISNKEVITTQCRSISPFISNNNGFREGCEGGSGVHPLEGSASRPDPEPSQCCSSDSKEVDVHPSKCNSQRSNSASSVLVSLSSQEPETCGADTRRSKSNGSAPGRDRLHSHLYHPPHPYPAAIRGSFFNRDSSILSSSVAANSIFD